MIENGHLVLRIPDECLLMDEIHMHNTELRSSAESLSELQKSEGGEPCPTKSKTSNHLDWCGPWYKSNWHQGNFLRTPSAPSQASSYTQRTILATKRKWTIIFANFLFARAQSIAASKMVTRLVRHYDQDERQSDASIRWDNMRTVLLKAFEKHGARNFSDEQCLRLGRDSRTARSPKTLAYFWAIQGHSGGIPIDQVDGVHSKSSQFE